MRCFSLIWHLDTYVYTSSLLLPVHVSSVTTRIYKPASRPFLSSPLLTSFLRKGFEQINTMVLTYAYHALSATTSTNYQFAHDSAGDVNVWLYPLSNLKLRLLSSTGMERHHQLCYCCCAYPLELANMAGDGVIRSLVKTDPLPFFVTQKQLQRIVIGIHNACAFQVSCVCRDLSSAARTGPPVN